MKRNRTARASASPSAAADQAAASPAEAGADEAIAFTPVPVRARRDGWTPERQREFIAALKRIGSVSCAARTLGKTRSSAYRLRERTGAESFAAAWDEAMERGFHNVHDHVIDRALHGAVVPRFRKGRQTGIVHRYYDAIAIAVLSGRGATIKQRLEEAEERGNLKAYFNIERAWKRDLEERDTHLLARREFESRLRALVDAGVIGREWLDLKARKLLLPSTPPQPAAARPSPPPERPGPRIRLL